MGAAVADGVELAPLEIEGRTIPAGGTYSSAFEAVAEAFAANFALEDEVGSSVSVVIDGVPVVDLWGGWMDESRSRPWETDTIVCMMSVAKGVAGIAFNMLVDRGLVDLDAPVAEYWPEFAQNGKADLPVRYLLDHRAGLPVLTPDKLWPGAMFDREAMTSALAAQAPLWTPGTVSAYHVHTQGYLLSEISLRVTGKLLGEFVRDEVVGPLGADYSLGLDRSQFDRVATLTPNMDSRLLASREEDPDSLRALAFAQNPRGPWQEMLNSDEFRAMDMPSASGHGNGRSVARIYGAISRGGGVDGLRLMSPESITRMATVQHDQVELLQERHYRQGLGVLLNSPGAVYMGPNPESFGHHGIGGSIGFADPVAKVGFGYSVNKMHSVGTNGPRARRLIDALYSVI